MNRRRSILACLAAFLPLLLGCGCDDSETAHVE